MNGDGFRWFRMVSGRVGLLRMVSDGFGWFAVLVITVYMYIYILISVVPFLYFDQFLYHLLPFS